MKIKNSELLNFVNSSLGNKRLPTKMAFAIALNAEEANSKIKIYDKKRKELAERLAKKDEKGEPVIENNRYVFEDWAAWDVAVQELLDIEVNCSITTVSLDDVMKCDEPGFDSLTVHEVSILKFMIED